jgi:hypothetical protein
MGTRGTWGVKWQGKEYLFYNHFDSYPEGLGQEMLRTLQMVTIDQIKKAIENAVVVEHEGEATEEQFERYKKIIAKLGDTVPDEAQAKLYGRTTRTWYLLLRDYQMMPEVYLSGTMPFWPLENEFIEDGLFCEFGYVLDLDAEELVMYMSGRDRRMSFPFDQIQREPELVMKMMCDEVYAEEDE